MKRILALLAALLGAASAFAASPAAQPNILFLLADDLGQMDIGAFNPKTFYETPNINALAKRGMKFTQGYAACSVCSPTRGSIMTGKYPPRFGITNFIPGGREPMIFVAPGVTKPGTTCDSPVISPDFYPTLLQLAGLPLKPAQHLDGVSFVPLLKGETMQRGKPLFWHYPHYADQGGAPNGVIRDGDWKLIEWYEDGALELYNIAGDISEKTNRAAQQPERVKELHAKLSAWRKEVGALMPTPNPEFDPAKEPQSKGGGKGGKGGSKKKAAAK